MIKVNGVVKEARCGEKRRSGMGMEMWSAQTTLASTFESRGPPRNHVAFRWKPGARLSLALLHCLSRWTEQ